MSFKTTEISESELPFQRKEREQAILKQGLLVLDERREYRK